MSIEERKETKLKLNRLERTIAAGLSRTRMREDEYVKHEFDHENPPSYEITVDLEDGSEPVICTAPAVYIRIAPGLDAKGERYVRLTFDEHCLNIDVVPAPGEDPIRSNSIGYDDLDNMANDYQEVPEDRRLPDPPRN